MDLIRANGVVVAYTKLGKGPSLVLMHGNEADHSMFDELAAYLAEDFTVYAYDQRDCGQTENPQSPYTLADLGDDAAAFVSVLGVERAHIYGTSLGGLVAQSLASRHPDRVDRLVLGNTWQAGTSPRDFNPQALEKLAAYRVDLAGNAPKIAELFFPATFIRERPSVVEMFRQNTRSEEKRIRRGTVVLGEMSADLSKFPRPVLLLTGTEDVLIPPEVTTAIASHIPNARTVQLEGIGHIGVIQDPDQVARILSDFLLSTGGGAV